MSGNANGDYAGSAATSGGSNLLGDGDGNGFTNGVNHDQTGVSNAMLGPLANNGGPTQTCAVPTGSPANGGDYSASTVTDQRGVARHSPQADDRSLRGSGADIPRGHARLAFGGGRVDAAVHGHGHLLGQFDSGRHGYGDLGQ